MAPSQVVAVVFLLNLASCTLLMRWWIWPRVAAVPVEDGLAPLAAFHLVRTLGLFALLPGMAGDYAAASRWAHHVAIGDTVSVLLAMVTVALLRARSRFALASAWSLNGWGLLDCLNAGRNGALDGILEHGLGAQAIVLGFGVPALLVTHAAMIVLLLRRARIRGTREGAIR